MDLESYLTSLDPYVTDLESYFTNLESYLASPASDLIISVLGVIAIVTIFPFFRWSKDRRRFGSNIAKKNVGYNLAYTSLICIFGMMVKHIIDMSFSAHEPDLIYEAAITLLSYLPVFLFQGDFMSSDLNIENELQPPAIFQEPTRILYQILGFLASLIPLSLLVLFLWVNAYIEYSMNSDVIANAVYLCTWAFLFLTWSVLSKSELREEGIYGKYFLICWKDINAYSFSKVENSLHINHKAIWPIARPMKFSFPTTEKDRIRELLEANVSIQMRSPE